MVSTVKGAMVPVLLALVLVAVAARTELGKKYILNM